MIPLVTRASSVSFKVRVTPRAGRTGAAGERNGALVVRLAAAPVEGAANDALVTYLAGVFDVPRRDVAIVSGVAARDKVVAIAGATAAHVTAKLLAILPA